MNIRFNWSGDEENAFGDFCKKHNFDRTKSEQFLCYLNLLAAHNQEFNLTRVAEGIETIERHFEDSLMLGEFIDCAKLSSIVDVGSGGGFPGIPLKIAYPKLRVILIEVVQKKVNFLNQVIKGLGLENISVYAFDWRTFLRKTDYQVDLFVARASLDPHELIRVFKPSSPYRTAQLVYWASAFWQAGPEEQAVLQTEYSYTLESKMRRLIFFGLGEHLPIKIAE